MLDALVEGVTTSIHAYQREGHKIPLSKQRKALRDLLVLLDQADPPISQIRARIANLPNEIIAHLDMRATRLVGHLRIDMLDMRATRLVGHLLRRGMPAGGVKTWAEQAPAEELVFFMASLIREGGIIVEGRKRFDGDRYSKRLEPVILGSAAGLHASNGSQSPKTIYDNRRPPHDALLRLACFLAADWDNATGLMPQPGRSERKPFGALVHLVFGWLGKERQATATLRRYWRLSQHGSTGPFDENAPR
jgi:hypothetical protein